MIDELNYMELKREKGIDIMLAVLIALSTFFDQYYSVISGVTLGEISLVFLSGVILYQKRFVLSYWKTKLFLSIYILSLAFSIGSIPLSQTGVAIDSSFVVITRCVRYFAYIVFCVLLIDNCELKRAFMRMYRVISLIAAMYAIVQFGLYIATGVYLPINIMPIEFSSNVNAELVLNNVQKYYFRAYGFFAEPSYLVKFLLPSFVFALYGWGKEKIDYLSVFTISLAIVCSTSTQGILIWGISLICYLIIFNRDSLSKQVPRMLAFMFFAIIIFIVAYKTGVADRPIQRVLNMFAGTSEMDHSSQVRILRGFAVWKQIPFFSKVFGVGLGNAGNYIMGHGITTQYDYFGATANSVAMNYMSGISKLLVENGIIVFLMFLGLMIKLLRKTDINGKVITLQLLMILLSGSNFFSLNSVFYFYCIFQFWGERNRYE